MMKVTLKTKGCVSGVLLLGTLVLLSPWGTPALAEEKACADTYMFSPYWLSIRGGHTSQDHKFYPMPLNQPQDIEKHRRVISWTGVRCATRYELEHCPLSGPHGGACPESAPPDPQPNVHAPNAPGWNRTHPDQRRHGTSITVEHFDTNGQAAHQDNLRYDWRYAFRVRACRDPEPGAVTSSPHWNACSGWRVMRERTCPKPHPNRPRPNCPEDPQYEVEIGGQTGEIPFNVQDKGFKRYTIKPTYPPLAQGGMCITATSSDPEIAQVTGVVVNYNDGSAHDAGGWNQHVSKDQERAARKGTGKAGQWTGCFRSDNGYFYSGDPSNRGELRTWTQMTVYVHGLKPGRVEITNTVSTATPASGYSHLLNQALGSKRYRVFSTPVTPPVDTGNSYVHQVRNLRVAQGSSESKLKFTWTNPPDADLIAGYQIKYKPSGWPVTCHRYKYPLWIYMGNEPQRAPDDGKTNQCRLSTASMAAGMATWLPGTGAEQASCTAQGACTLEIQRRDNTVPRYRIGDQRFHVRAVFRKDGKDHGGPWGDDAVYFLRSANKSRAELARRRYVAYVDEDDGVWLRGARDASLAGVAGNRIATSRAIDDQAVLTAFKLEGGARGIVVEADQGKNRWKIRTNQSVLFNYEGEPWGRTCEGPAPRSNSRCVGRFHVDILDAWRGGAKARTITASPVNRQWTGANVRHSFPGKTAVVELWIADRAEVPQVLGVSGGPQFGVSSGNTEVRITWTSDKDQTMPGVDPRGPLSNMNRPPVTGWEIGWKSSDEAESATRVLTRVDVAAGAPDGHQYEETVTLPAAAQGLAVTQSVQPYLDIRMRAINDEGKSVWTGVAHSATPDPSPVQQPHAEVETAGPAANAGPDLEGAPGQVLTLQGTGSSNPHGQWWEMTHAWSHVSGPPVSFSLDPARRSAWPGRDARSFGDPRVTIASHASPGDRIVLALTVTDSDGVSDTDEMVLTVAQASSGAATLEVSADAGADFGVSPGAAATLGAETEAVEGWTYAWAQTSGPSVALDGANAPRASFMAPVDAADGTAFGFTLRVTDAGGAEASDETRVTVARPASACRTDFGAMGVGASAGRGAEYWDNAECRAHHRVDRPARYYRFTLTERATVDIDVTTDAAAALFVSKGEPKNGWGTPPKATMAHRLSVRRANGKLVHEEALAASMVLEPGAYTAEAVLDVDGSEAWRLPSFGLSVAATAPPAAVSVSDARVEEGPGAVLSFAVTLDGPASGTARVSWSTSDGTAVAGEDYTAGAGTLTFAPGETEKTVEVAVLDDAHDEGEETLTLTLSAPEGVLLGDAEATGTIANEDALLNAWLARFGRTVAGQTVAAVTERLAAPAGTGSHVTLGGQRIGPIASGGSSGLVSGADRGPGQPPASDAKRVPTALAAAGEANRGWRSGTGSALGAGVIPGSPGAAESRGMTGRDLLLGSAFHLSAGGGGDGRGPRWTAWGRASLERFENADGGLPVDGEVVTGVVGADWERGDWLAGVALTHGVGEGAMHPRRMAMEYHIDSTVTAFNPYLRVRLSERLSAWALVGYGRGDLTLTQKREASGDGAEAGSGRTAWEADLALTLGAAGARGALLVPEETGGFGLALRGDAFWVRTTSDAIRGVEGLGNLAAAEADASRVRLVLEGSRVVALAGGRTLTPSLELGVRQDGGDAETGMGLVLGGGLRYADPGSGVSMELGARTLLAHADSGYREWGLSGALRVAPGGAGRGLSLSLTPAYGADAGGTARLWSARDALALAPANGNADPRARLEAEVGYGLPVHGDRFTGTPYAGFGYSGADRRYRLGWRLTGADDPGAFVFSLGASRREAANDDEPDHGIGFRLTVRW